MALHVRQMYCFQASEPLSLSQPVSFSPPKALPIRRLRAWPARAAATTSRAKGLGAQVQIQLISPCRGVTHQAQRLGVSSWT